MFGVTFLVHKHVPSWPATRNYRELHKYDRQQWWTISLPWGSRWARCAGAPSARPCWVCVCLHHFRSSCRKRLSTRPSRPRAESAFCWEERKLGTRQRFGGEITKSQSGDVCRGALTCLESHASVAKRRSAACLSVIEEKLCSPSSLRG